MNLTIRDYEILSTYQDLGEEPINKTAQVASLKAHTVRRCIMKALASGVLTRRAFINFHELGLQQYAAMLSFDHASQQNDKQIRDALRTHKHVELALKLDGSTQYQYYVLITTTSATNLETIITSISSVSKASVTKTRLQVRRGYCYFGSKYLGTLRTPTPIEVRSSDRRISLPEEDIDVLEVFSASRNGVRTQMARTLHMPLMTLQYRIERLGRLGVIRGVRYYIDSKAVGHEQFRCLIVAKLPLESYRKQLVGWASTHRYVVALMDGVGSWDYELWLETPTNEMAQAVVEEMIRNFPSIIQTTELIRVDSVIKITSHSSFSATIGTNGNTSDSAAS